MIKPLSNFIYRAMQVGVLLIAAGTILGGVWADASWGRFWGWDPKEVWALITLLVYLIPLHGRFAGWVTTFGLVVASVVCFLSVVMAWYGVNFVLGVGLHSYGFVEGGLSGPDEHDHRRRDVDSSGRLLAPAPWIPARVNSGSKPLRSGLLEASPSRAPRGEHSCRLRVR